jgi:aminopeptidase S
MRRLVVLAVTLSVAAALLLWPSPPSPVHQSIHIGGLPTLTMADLRPHLEAFERIARDNEGSRGHGTVAYSESVEYVAEKLAAAGFRLTRQEFGWQREYSANLIADWPGGDEDNVLMIGAHLDSVAAGPGINDNGSGSAAILALALAVAAKHHRPARHLRFAWWGTEELGLIGSKHYVRSLSPSAAAAIVGYLNVDMIASPNGGHFLYDSDDSRRAGEGPGAPGSELIEQALTAYFSSINVPVYEIDFDGRSDYAPFLAAGIPVGGLVTGSRELKPQSMAELWGGRAGEPFDPCYHQPCDTNANINETIYVRNANAAAHAFWTLSKG